MIKKTFRSPRIASLVAALIATFATAMAQKISVVDFVRPTDMSIAEAYIVDFVDRAPQFPGGEAAMIHFINTERTYPRDAYEARIQGRVMCAFIVDTDGSIVNVTIQRGPCQSLNNEAMRIISSMPRWEAGEIHGRKVPVCYFLTIPFRL